jgi:hypothetical protein
MGRVDAQIDGYRGDVLFAARFAVRFVFDFFAEFFDIGYFFALAMENLCLFFLSVGY